MRIGYARVSTLEQNLKLQLAALKNAGCERIFEDLGVSGKINERKGLAAAMKSMKPGDTLVVWRLDRLGRSLGHLIDLINRLAGMFCKLCAEPASHSFTAMASLAER